MKRPIARRSWTDADRALARALARCRFGWLAKSAKQFAAGMAAAADRPGDPGVTEKQAAALRRLVAAYRMQIPPETIPEECRYLLTAAAAERLRLRTEFVLTEERKARAIRRAAVSLVPTPAPAAGPEPQNLELELG